MKLCAPARWASCARARRPPGAAGVAAEHGTTLSRIELGETAPSTCTCSTSVRSSSRRGSRRRSSAPTTVAGSHGIREVFDADAALGEIVKYTTKTGIAAVRVLGHARSHRYASDPRGSLGGRDREPATARLPRRAPHWRKPAEVPAAEEDTVDDAEGSRPTQCEQCGSTALEEVTVDLLDYVRHMHARGVPALRGSRAPPPRPSGKPPPAIVAPAPAPWSPIDFLTANPATPGTAFGWAEEWVSVRRARQSSPFRLPPIVST